MEPKIVSSVWECSDGSLWRTREEALDREEEIKEDKEIKLFIKDHYSNFELKFSVMNNLRHFLSWRRKRKKTPSLEGASLSDL